MLQCQICYHSHLNVSQKTKTNINFMSQTWVKSPATCWVESFILSDKYHAQYYYQTFWHTLANKIAKTNNNIAGFHSVSRRVIFTSLDVQRVCRCPKRTFILPRKYHVSVSNMLLQTLKCVIKKKTNINFRSEIRYWHPAKW